MCLAASGRPLGCRPSRCGAAGGRPTWWAVRSSEIQARGGRVGFAVAPSRFLVKQISADSTGSRALEREASESVDREVVSSWLAPKSRRGSEPICVDIHRHFLSKNQLTSM